MHATHQQTYGQALTTIEKYLERFDPASAVDEVSYSYPDLSASQVVAVLRHAELVTVELRQALRTNIIRARRSAAAHEDTLAG